MSILFETVQVGSMPVRNRFVHSATHEVMAAADGRVTDEILHRYETLDKPRQMSRETIRETVQAFVDAARRAAAAGADAVQLHGAHGYLICEFLSPFYNRRKDEYGGSAESRFRFLREIVDGVRSVLPAAMPVTVKMNAAAQAACISCNMCSAAMFNEMPVRCYHGGLPEKRGD